MKDLREVGQIQFFFKMDFVAIDFETASSRPASACSLAAVTVENGEVARVAYSLIRPPDMRFDPWNIRIHGITPQAVEGKPQFDQLWERVKLHLDRKIVIAHNAAFDIGVLRSLLDYYGLEKPDMHHVCTVTLARKVWPGLKSYRLSHLAEQFGIQFQHHHALDDARTCAQIALLAGKEISADSFPDLLKKLGISVKAFY